MKCPICGETSLHLTDHECEPMMEKEKPLCPSDATPCSPSLLTSETDAMVAADLHHLEDDETCPASAYWRIVELTRTLERERDEWRNKAVDLHARHKNALEDIEAEIAERNEAREVARAWRDNWLNGASMSMLSGSKLPWENDQALPQGGAKKGNDEH